MPGQRPSAIAGRRSRSVVTGGAGFVGSHLADALLAAGHIVAALDDLSAGSTANLAAGVELIECDVADPSTVGHLARWDPDLVFHLAAQTSVPRSVADPQRDRAVNVTGTAHVIEGARQADAARLIFVSSGGAIYGESRQADEETAPAPASPYGRNKLAAEELVRGSGLSWAIARPSNIYGPRQRSDLEGGVVAIFCAALRDGRPATVFGDGRQVRDFIYVADVVTALQAAASAERPGLWNVAAGRSTSLLDLLDKLQRLDGRSIEVRHEARRAGDVAESGLDNRRIRRELGWRPRHSLDEGLRRTLAGTR